MSNSKKPIITHNSAEVKTQMVGAGTVIWQFAVILEGAVIGQDCNINCHTFIENDVVIGNNVTLKCGVYLWNGITLEDNVFVGPNTTFTNDKYPRSGVHLGPRLRTIVKSGASIGANATILAGTVIGSYALIGAGAVVTRSVPGFALVAGNPASIIGWVDEKGNKMQLDGNTWVAIDGRRFKVENNQLMPI